MTTTQITVAPELDAWRRRIQADAEAVQRLDRRHRELTAAVVHRARAHGSLALALTGSVARGKATPASDIDYYAVGPRFEVWDLARELAPESEVDLCATDPDRFLAKVRAGDDYAQWALRYGRVLFDDGVLRAACTELEERKLWPDTERKRRQAERALHWAEAILDTGDVEAAQEQLRVALSALARWTLLQRDLFPLARAELAGQLRSAGLPQLAESLDRSIWTEMAEPEIRKALLAAEGATSRPVSPRRGLTPIA